MPPCKEFKDKLIKCYQKHPREVLSCNQEVSDFTHCVNAHRANVLDEKQKKQEETPKSSINASAASN